MAVSFNVLGPLRVDGGQSIRLTAAKPQRILALLLLNANRVVTIERIRDELWSDHPPRSWASNVSTYLTLVRRAVSPHIESHPVGHQACIGRQQLDLNLFRDGVAAARQALAARDLDRAAGEFRQANGLWAGTALEGLPVGSVLSPLVHALEEERLAAMEDQFDVALLRGRHRPTLPALVANATAHPSRERSWAQLMVAFYRCGRVGDALRAYGRIQRWLHEEFNVSPSPLLQHLRHRIWTGDPTLSRGGWRSETPHHHTHHSRGGIVARAT